MTAALGPKNPLLNFLNTLSSWVLPPYEPLPCKETCNTKSHFLAKKHVILTPIGNYVAITYEYNDRSLLRCINVIYDHDL